MGEPEKQPKAKPGPEPERLVIPPEKGGDALDRLVGKPKPKSGGGGQGPPREPEKKPKPS